MHKNERITCTICGENYWSLQGLERHRQDVHDTRAVPVQTKDYIPAPASPVPSDSEGKSNSLESEDPCCKVYTDPECPTDPGTQEIEPTQGHREDETSHSQDSKSSLLLIDTHSHFNLITDLSVGITKERLEDILDKEWSLGFDKFILWKILCVLHNPARWDGINFENFDSSVVKLAVGIHPCMAHLATPGKLDHLEYIAGHEAVIAIGETGLDYKVGRASPRIQRNSLRKHTAIASRLKLPLILHLRGRGSIEDYLEMSFDLDTPIIIHSVALPWYLIEKALRRQNTFLSFNSLLVSGGDEGERMREAAQKAPLHSVLLETDAPKLKMVAPNGEHIKGSPGSLRSVLQVLYDLRTAVGMKMTVEDFSGTIFINSLKALPGLKGRVDSSMCTYV